MRIKLICKVKFFRNEVFEEYMQKHKLSKTGFCKLCKIGYGTFNKILTDNFDLRINALEKISNATGIKLQDMMNKVPNEQFVRIPKQKRD